jgi:hypothetical protein
VPTADLAATSKLLLVLDVDAAWLEPPAADSGVPLVVTAPPDVSGAVVSPELFVDDPAAMRLTMLPDAVAGSESRDTPPVVPSEGAGAAGVAVGLAEAPVGFGVAGVDAAGGVDAGWEVVGGAALVVSAGAELEGRGAWCGADPPEFSTGGGAVGADVVGVALGHSDAVEGSPEPGLVHVGVAVSVAVAVPSLLVLGDGGPPGLVGGDVSVGAQVGRCDLWWDSSGSSGPVLELEGTESVASEVSALGWPHASPSSCALAPWPGKATATMIAAATQRAAADAPPSRLRRVIRVSIPCVECAGRPARPECVPHVQRSNEASLTRVRPLLGQPEG